MGIEEPPPSSQFEGPMIVEQLCQSGSWLSNEAGIQAPRRGMVPKRINFAMVTCRNEHLNIDFGALRDPDWERRRQAAVSLGSCYLGRHPGEFNQEAANVIMPALRAALRDEHCEVRAQAAKSLADLGPEAVWHAVPVLWETCSDPEELVRQSALKALRDHGQEVPPERLQQPRSWCRSWQEPPSLQAVREDLHEDCQSEGTLLQEDLSTTANSGESSHESSHMSVAEMSPDMVLRNGSWWL